MATKFTKKQYKQLPKYVRFGGVGCAMRLHNPEYKQYFGWKDNIFEYYRDGGHWAVDIRLDEETGKVYSISQYADTPQLDNREMIPITYWEWKKDNGEYTEKTTKAH
jgi:hypothetical protein